MKAGPGFSAVHSPRLNLSLWEEALALSPRHSFSNLHFTFCIRVFCRNVFLGIVYAVPAETRRGCLSSGTGVRAGCEPDFWVLSKNSQCPYPLSYLFCPYFVFLMSFPGSHVGTPAQVSQAIFLVFVLHSPSCAALARMHRCSCIRRNRAGPYSLKLDFRSRSAWGCRDLDGV